MLLASHLTGGHQSTETNTNFYMQFFFFFFFFFFADQKISENVATQKIYATASITMVQLITAHLLNHLHVIYLIQGSIG